MGIRFFCPNGHKLNVKAELAGKRAICPDCGAKLVVPAQAGASPSALAVREAREPLSVSATASESVAELPTAAATVEPLPTEVFWYLRPASGGQFGPIGGEELAAWIADGRLTPDAYLWRAGWDDWRMASDVPDDLPGWLPTTTILTAPEQPLVAEQAAPEREARDLKSQQPESPSYDSAIDVPESLDLTAQVGMGRRRQSAPLLVTIVLVFAIAILVGVLIWVIRRSSGSEAPRAAGGQNSGCDYGPSAVSCASRNCQTPRARHIELCLSAIS
jgi:hypothetical protein